VFLPDIGRKRGQERDRGHGERGNPQHHPGQTDAARDQAGRAEQQPGNPADEFLPRGAGGEIGPVELVEIGAHPARKLGARRRLADAFARRDAAQFKRAGPVVGFAPDPSRIWQPVFRDVGVFSPHRIDKALDGVHGALIAHPVDDDDGLHRCRGRVYGRGRLRHDGGWLRHGL